MIGDESIVVIGIGNGLRGDDQAGLAVAESVRALVPDGVTVRICEEEPTRLIDAFAGADVAIVVDAVSTGSPAGTVHRFDASLAPIPSKELRSSTHAIGIGETVELARALGRLPRRTVIFGVEGADFGAGQNLSAAAGDGVARASERVLEEVARCTNRP